MAFSLYHLIGIKPRLIGVKPYLVFQFFQSASRSITSVIYLKDELCIATAGAVDRCVYRINSQFSYIELDIDFFVRSYIMLLMLIFSVFSIVKFWDTRNLKKAITVCQPESNDKVMLKSKT